MKRMKHIFFPLLLSLLLLLSTGITVLQKVMGILTVEAAAWEKEPKPMSGEVRMVSA